MSDNGTEDVRFCKEKFPQPGDCVVVVVGKTTENGVHVKLLEYGQIDGLIRREDIAPCKVVIAREGKNEVVKVLSVNAETGHIELSKLQVTDDEHKKCDDKYHRAVTADGVLRYVSDQTEIEVSVAQLYEDIGWPLVEKYGSLYDAFIASKKNDQVWQPLTFAAPEVLSALIACVNIRISPNPIKLYAEIDVLCNGYGGIDAIKSALFAGEAMGTDIVPIKTRYIAAARYKIGSERCYDRVLGLETLANAVDAVKEVIRREEDGECNVRKWPDVSAEEKSLLGWRLSQLVKEAEEADWEDEADWEEEAEYMGWEEEVEYMDWEEEAAREREEVDDEEVEFTEEN